MEEAAVVEFLEKMFECFYTFEGSTLPNNKRMDFAFAGFQKISNCPVEDSVKCNHCGLRLAFLTEI